MVGLKLINKKTTLAVKGGLTLNRDDIAWKLTTMGFADLAYNDRVLNAIERLLEDLKED